MKCNKCGQSLPGDSLFCQYCGNRIEHRVPETGVSGSVLKTMQNFVPHDQMPPSRGALPAQNSDVTLKTVSAVDVMTVVMYALTIICSIVAMNLQDIKRNAMESISPTAVYLFFVGICVIGVYFSLFARRPRFPIAQHIYSFVPAVFAAIALVEGSLFAGSYVSGETFTRYVNADLISILNVVCLLANFAVVVINLAPLVTNLLGWWHSSISYRERCYVQVEKMKCYLDKGIITHEEYEKNKADILKTIQM